MVVVSNWFFHSYSLFDATGIVAAVRHPAFVAFSKVVQHTGLWTLLLSECVYVCVCLRVRACVRKWKCDLFLSHAFSTRTTLMLCRKDVYRKGKNLVAHSSIF